MMTAGTPHLSNQVALFEIDEIKFGKRLGKGGFCNVHEVRALQLKSDTRSCYSHGERTKRNHVKSQAKSKTGGGCVIKTIKPEKMMPERDFLVAAGDLEMEASLLSRLRHPNIIELRGIACEGRSAYITTGRHDGYFLILDRLKETLKDRIVSWKREMDRLTHPNMFVGIWSYDRIMKRKQELLVERFMAALDIASALEYLHSQRIIYRDLKSANCGFKFDLRGSSSQDECLLFDLGLARTLPEEGDMMNDTYVMSGKVGTTRYMAPEVFRCEPYGLKADVFSFAHLLWEILSLEVPYAHFTRQDYKWRVVKRGCRPVIDSTWPNEIQQLLQEAWDADMDERPTMKRICVTLQVAIANVEGSEEYPQKSQLHRSVSPHPTEASLSSGSNRSSPPQRRRFQSAPCTRTPPVQYIDI